ncbi:MAG TPA: YdeI/OmpD-associated family protein [Dokdonella sp.]
MQAKDLPIHAFADLAAWERWLRRNGERAAGAWLKFSKAGAPVPTLAKREAIEGALCHGWIDGQLAAFDAHYFLIRFTPRRRGSAWSRINRDTAQRLLAEGRVAPNGLREIETAKANGGWDSAYASQANATVPADLQAALKAAPKAKKGFDALDGANRYAIIYRVMQPKKAQTRARRIEQFVEMLLRGETIHPPGGRRKR